MDIRYYLKRPDSNTETVIFARISYSGRKLKYYLPKKVLPKKWDYEKQRLVGNTKDVKDFNSCLNKTSTDIQNAFDKYVLIHEIQPSTDKLKELLDKDLKDIQPEKEKNIDKRFTFFGYFEDLIEKSKSGKRLNPKTSKPISPNTIKAYNTTFKLLKEFQKETRRNIDFNTIDLDFYEALRDYTLNKRYSDSLKDKKQQTINLGYSTNTIGKHIQVLKTILNEAKDLGYNTYTTYQSSKFKTLREEVDTIYLTKDEINALSELDLSNNKKYETVRDLFLIGCYTGQAYTDYSNITKNNISNKFIKYNRQKTGVGVSIPIRTELRAILEKYKYNLPKSYSNQKTNEYLKEIGKLIPNLLLPVEHSKTIGGKKIISEKPKYELLTTHTARRTFASNEYLNGTPVLSIMALTGHKTEKSFMKYIRLNSDDHAKLVQLYWEKEEINKLKVV